MPLAALLFFAMVQDPSPPDLDAKTCVQDPPACVQVAGAHFDAGRFDDAVRLFETLTAEFPGTAKYRYYAGIAREGAGDDTAAYVHMRRFLAIAAADSPDRGRATRRIAAILARTTRVTLRTPKHDDPLILHLRRTGATHSGEPPFIIPLSILPAAKDGTHELALTPGGWELTLDPARLGDMKVAPLRTEIPARARGLMLELVASPIRHQLTLELGPERALDRGMTIQLRRIGGLTFKVTPDTATVRRELPPGTWTYEARARGFRPQKHPIVLDGPLTVPIKLTSKWSEERRKRLKLGLGLAGAGLVTGIAGGVLLANANARLKYRRKFDGEGQDKEPAFIIADIGGSLLGTTLGVWIGAISSTSRSRRLWLAEAGIGALTIAGATTWYSVTAEKKNLPDSRVPRTPFELGSQTLIAAGLLGLGSGLLTSSIVTLLSKRNRRLQKGLARRRFSINPSMTTPRISLQF